MKTSELVVGTAYAYKRSSWSEPEKVTVLEPKATGTKKVGPFGRTEKVSGVKVRIGGPKKGYVDYVRPATIVCTWAEQKQADAERKAYRAEQDAAMAKETAHRARTAFTLHKALEAKGAKVGVGYTYDDDVYAALVEAGFEPHTPEYQRPGSHLVSTLTDLSGVVKDGKVPIEHVALLLGTAESLSPAAEAFDPEEV